MYVPGHFALTLEQSLAVLAQAPVGELITHPDQGLVATYLPLLHQPGEGLGRLIGHISRVNDQWEPALEEPMEALFLAHGPDSYIPSDWLSTADSQSVPTWNYLTVQVWGSLRAHTDPEWIQQSLEQLCGAYRDNSLERVGPAAVAKMRRAVIGVELRIERVLGKAKMSQNRTPEVIGQVIKGLRETGPSPVADWMSEHSLPRAEEKAAKLSAIRRQHRTK